MGQAALELADAAMSEGISRRSLLRWAAGLATVGLAGGVLGTWLRSGSDLTRVVPPSETWQEIASWQGSRIAVRNGLAFAHGQVLFWPDRDATVKRRDLSTGAEGVLPLVPLKPTAIGAIACSSDGATLAIGYAAIPLACADPAPRFAIKVWDLARNQERCTIWHRHGLTIALELSPDGGLLASSAGHELKLWDTARGMEVRTLDPFISRQQVSSLNSCLAFSPNGRALVCAGTVAGQLDRAMTFLLDVQTGEPLQSLPGLGCAAFSPDGTTLALGRDRAVQLWDISRHRVVRVLEGHRNFVHSVCFAPHGLSVASSSDREMRVWDLATGQTRAVFTRKTAHVNHTLAFSRDGQLLAGVGDEGQVTVWNRSQAQSPSLPVR
jgi:WD40 repeat protein